jgi:hypothetical protein
LWLDTRKGIFIADCPKKIIKSAYIAAPDELPQLGKIADRRKERVQFFSVPLKFF